jgi:hypothetical protein
VALFARIGPLNSLNIKHGAGRIDSMHELSIALSLIDAVCEEMPAWGPDVSVRSIRVRVGPLSGVLPHALAFAFEVAVADSPLAGARLEIEEAEGRDLQLAAVEVVDGTADCRGSPQHFETK